MKQHYPVVVAAVLVTALANVGCHPQAVVDLSAEETALRDADTAWSKSATAKQLDGILAYYTDDASIFPANAPIGTGKEGIRKTWTELLAAPGFGIAWKPVRAQVASSGDLGYTHGTYELTMNGPKGAPLTDRGKYVVVWKKQAGTWKAVADIFNSDLPPAPPPSK